MPLPDERPRQSVANLIGRFETQTKRLSSASSPPRSSSVVSHITGDSNREETKEKREWPPKSVNGPVEKPPLILPSLSSRNIPSALITTSMSKPSIPSIDEPEVPLTAKALNASQRQVQAEPNAFLENWRKDLPVSQTEVEAETPATLAVSPPIPQEDQNVATPTLASVQKFATPSKARTSNVSSKSATTRTPASATAKVSSSTTRTPAKTPLKSPSAKQSLTPTVAQPLRPQHTGQSVASTNSTRKPALPKTPVTPAKTPVRPDASRAKTPTSSRPKTPSTGLFAPTAASLARSRNAPPQMPTPIKKATLSSSAMDRLSKPTAASQARMAAAAPVTPPRGAAATSRTPAAKPKATTPASSKKPARKEPVLPLVTGEAVPSAPKSRQGSDAGDKSEIVDFPGPGSPTAGVEAKSEQVQDEVITEPVKDETGNTGSGDNEAAPIFEITEVTTAPDEEKPTATNDTKNDLEDIVNLLESVPIAKPVNDTITIPDEILEIPDEDDK
ncbi:hypothetical protein M413DRAFT_446653 [Hebeloma cylindrosporum]|uniref:Uncharacterized protein n=1 Tax=Hebeloma cylindrosporum TaxID=76867 RepID=A0A0C3C841_HEBCY|nr:hypothetical protein M413DRAFT_446653 [Hebeloma cylindrosporum h7]